MLAWIHLGLTFILAVLAYFFGTELLKKFRYWFHIYEANASRVVDFDWPGCDKVGRKPGMGNIVIWGCQPFVAGVAFQLDLPMFKYRSVDVFGDVISDETGMAVFSTYLGRGATRFRFLLNIEIEECHVQVRSSNIDQFKTPTETFLPHWYQKLGIFG